MSSYLALNPGNVTKNTDWTLGGLSNVNVFRIAGQLAWSPVKDMDIGVEVAYLRLNQSLAHAPGFAPTCGAGPQLGAALPNAACSALGALSPSSNVWEGFLRVTRQF